MADIIEKLRERAHFAREEGTGTADADASYFDASANEIERLRSALTEAERFMAYFANETNGHFVGIGTPTSCLAQIRAALPSAERNADESA